MGHLQQHAWHSHPGTERKDMLNYEALDIRYLYIGKRFDQVPELRGQAGTKWHVPDWIFRWKRQHSFNFPISVQKVRHELRQHKPKCNGFHLPQGRIGSVFLSNNQK